MHKITGRYTLTLTTTEGELLETIELNGQGFPLPLRRLGPESLAEEINERIKRHELDHPPAGEVPI